MFNPPAGTWMGFDTAGLIERNRQIAEDLKNKAEQDKVNAASKCELCGRVE
jgi:hypothetical protein